MWQDSFSFRRPLREDSEGGLFRDLHERSLYSILKSSKNSLCTKSLRKNSWEDLHRTSLHKTSKTSAQQISAKPLIYFFSSSSISRSFTQRPSRRQNKDVQGPFHRGSLLKVLRWKSLYKVALDLCARISVQGLCTRFLPGWLCDMLLFHILFRGSLDQGCTKVWGIISWQGLVTRSI